MAEDKTIKIAPEYVEEFRKFNTEAKAIENIMQMATRQCFNLQREVAVKQGILWEKIRTEYNLDRKSEYSHRDGIVTTIQEPDTGEERAK